MDAEHPLDPSRRSFIAKTAAAAAGAALAGTGGVAGAKARPGPDGRSRGPHHALEEATIAELGEQMASGQLSARRLTMAYLQRIRQLDEHGPQLNSILTINPRALEIAELRDAERKAGKARGPLHGIPIVLKDNIDTLDRMHSTAGSLALVDSKPQRDATVARRLRRAGAIILGKTNLSEWANFRSTQSSSGWSGVAGQTRNPYVLDRNPCGSSSGSGTSVSANLAAASLGTETDGSIVCPASATGIVGIKPTVGLTSRAGVVPISHSQDTVGPMCRTVADAAVVLGAMTGVDPRDPATRDSRGRRHRDYSQFLDPDGLHGARIGVARNLTGFSPETDEIFEAAVTAIRDAGATVVDPANLDSAAELDASGAEFEVLLYEFKTDIRRYLATRSAGSPRTLKDLIEFNEAHAGRELRWFGQEIFELAQAKGPLTDPAYRQALRTGRRLARAEGLDKVLGEHNLNAIVAPTGSPAWPTDLVNGDHFLGGSSSVAAVAGYPLISVPAGFAFGLPVGITFMGAAFAEPTLIRVASGFEAATGVRRAPDYQPTLPY
ncbi:MAG: amidase [Actinomycetota bacterium]|jgi:amidase|nr:amidase [Actinomycetota bacterium]